MKRDWTRHWRGNHRAFPITELHFDDFTHLKAPFYGEKKTSFSSLDEVMFDRVGCAEVDSYTKFFNAHLWSLMESGYRVPYELWTLA